MKRSPHTRDSPSRLHSNCAVVIGLSGVGRYVAAQLASLGIGRLELIDGGTVQAAHYAREGYFAEDSGRPKVDATAELCHRLNPRLDVHTSTRIRPAKQGSYDAVFLCIQSPAWRRLAREAFADRASFFASVSVDGGQIKAVAVGDRRAIAGRRRQPLIEGLKRRPLPKTRAAGRPPTPLLHAACLAASLLVSEFLRPASSQRSTRQIRLDLRTLRLAVDRPS